MVLLEDKTYQDLIASGEAKDDEILLLKATAEWYREQLGLAKTRLYSPKSEHAPVGQEPLLFNEAEACASEVIPDAQSEALTLAPRTPRGKRQQNLEDLPFEEIDYVLPAEEQICPACAGALHAMGEDVKNKIKMIPARAVWVKHVQKKYACRNCQQNAIKTPVLIAPMSTDAFPNSLASPSAVAHIISDKFVQATPLYRQEQSLQRLGLTLSRQTMANWVLAGAAWLEILLQRMQKDLLSRDILHADETPLQVLKEPGRAAQTKSYLWLYRSGREGPAIVLFEYQQTRAGEHPRRFLKDFTGFVNVDGYAGYAGVPHVTLAGCWAHARRKFVEALDSLPTPVRKNGCAPAHEGLFFCDELFRIERALHDVTAEERKIGRGECSEPHLAAFRAWLDAAAIETTPTSLLGQAITYSLNQWPKLIVFLTDGRLEIDNNRAERSIKPFVIGRKNWLFANTPRGARSSAVIYSVVETAKENGLDPRRYIEHLFEVLPGLNQKDPAALDALLPWSPEIQSRFGVPPKSIR